MSDIGLGFGGSISGVVSDIKVEPSDGGDKLSVKRLPSSKSSNKKNKQSRGDDSKSSDAVGAKVMLKHGFGSTALQVDGIQSFSTILGEKEVNDRIMYRVGRHICVYDPESGRQQFFTGRPCGVTNALHFSISPNSRYVSICESTRTEKSDSGHAQATIYSLTTFSRQKVLTHQSPADFICSSFCGDVKFLVTLTDEPERSVILWQWEKERIFKSANLSFKVCNNIPLCALTACCKRIMRKGLPYVSRNLVVSHEV